MVGLVLSTGRVEDKQSEDSLRNPPTKPPTLAPGKTSGPICLFAPAHRNSICMGKVSKRGVNIKIWFCAPQSIHQNLKYLLGCARPQPHHQTQQHRWLGTSFPLPSVRSPNELCFVRKRVQAFLLLLPVLQHWCWLLKGSTHLFPSTGTGEGRQEEEPEREQLAHT